MWSVMRKVILYAAPIVVGSAIPSAASAQWVQWSTASGGNGHWYRLTTRAGTWTDAQGNATSLGGYLVTIGSQAENDFLQSTFFPSGTNAFWIGLRRSGPLSGGMNYNDFVWDNGEAVTYTNWLTGEPNNCLCGFARPDAGERFGLINYGPYIQATAQSTYAPNGDFTRGAWDDQPNEGFDTSVGALGSNPFFGIVEADTVPEPSSIALIATGMLPLGVAMRRRRKGP